MLIVTVGTFDRLLTGDHTVVAWRESGLIAPSIVTGIVRTVKHDMIARKMGELPANEMRRFDDTLRSSLAL